MMARGTNPFDDYSDEEQDAISPVASERKYRAGTNPFADDEFMDDVVNVENEGYADQDEEVESLQEVDDDIPVEASWQFLRDLPYRRVPIYSNICWNRREEEEPQENGGDSSINNGLAAFPPSFLNSQNRSNLLDARDVRELLSTTTVTKVAGCPHGGPIAAITLPILGDSGSARAMSTTELRIMTNAGRPLANVEFPPRGLAHAQRRLYAAADVMTIGFTDRMTLIVVLRDSLCLTYDLRGNMLLPPFHILPSSVGSNTGSNKVGTELLQASVYEGGVAVLSTSMQCAIVELFDDHDDPTYADSANLASRKIVPNSSSGAASADEMFVGGQTDSLPANYAIVTPLSTAAHASENYYSYVALAVLPRFHTTSRHPEVFLSTSDNSVVVVNTVNMEIIDVDCRARISSPIVAMTFAPNGRFLACFTQASILTVISTSFETKVLDFDTSDGSSAPPLEMKWCGEDSVVLHWKNLGVLMVGPYGDWLRFPYEDVDHLYIIPEIDCCRVVTDNAVELLQRVPPATALLMRIGSIEPSAMLLDAADAFAAGSPASDEAARAITKTGMLLEAIETCSEAATREFDIVTQKRLLRAASYGMHFAYKDPGDQRNVMGGSTDESERDAHTMPSPTAVKFVAAARKIRILNALRHPAVGFVLTASQYETITPTGVVARLIAMKRPALATSISKYLSQPKSVQLFARASKAAALVSSDTKHTDAETADAAIKIINEDAAGESQDTKAPISTLTRGGYATVALAANKAGRPGVANLLLMLETSVADKVPALVSIGSYADAVAVATTARDADFIFYALMEFEKTCMASSVDLGQTNFFGTVVSKFTFEAFNTLRTYLATMPDVNKVKTLLLRAQKFADAGITVARRAMDRNAEKRDKQVMLIEAARVFGLGKETAFHKSCTDDYLELLNDQEILRNKYGSRDFLPESSSVTSTIISVIRYAAVNQRESNRLLSDADKLAKKFRVPEKRLWHVKVRALADSGQWDHLKALADSKAKPPIGFKPFALAAIKGKQDVTYIMRFIERVAQTEERYDLFCEANMWNRALEEAARLKDVRRIAHVRSVCNSADIQQRCDKMMEAFVG